ncbi:hypothetical protein Hanom_Chr04g00295371 [Helianthus anomalus]
MCLWILDCSPHITVDSCCLGNHSGLLLFNESQWWILVVWGITVDYCCSMNHSGLFLHEDAGHGKNDCVPHRGQNVWPPFPTLPVSPST